jgi:hypothetical protein
MRQLGAVAASLLTVGLLGLQALEGAANSRPGTAPK